MSRFFPFFFCRRRLKVRLLLLCNLKSLGLLAALFFRSRDDSFLLLLLLLIVVVVVVVVVVVLDVFSSPSLCSPGFGLETARLVVFVASILFAPFEASATFSTSSSFFFLLLLYFRRRCGRRRRRRRRRINSISKRLDGEEISSPKVVLVDD